MKGDRDSATAPDRIQGKNEKMKKRFISGACLTLAASLLLVSGCSEPTETALHRSSIDGSVPRFDLSNLSEWRASTFTRSTQAEASLATGTANEIVACWSSRRQQGGRYGVYAQRFDRDGLAIGEETALGIWNKTHQTAPVMAADGQGGYWAAWTSHGQDGYLGSIIARHFDSNFVGGDEILVNAQTAGHQCEPVLAVTDDGTALVAYLSPDAESGPQVLKARMIGLGELGEERTIAQLPNGEIRVPSLARGTHGIAVAYSVFEDGLPAGIRVQMLDSDAGRRGEVIPVSGPAKLSQIEPTIVAQGDGYLVGWLDAETDGDSYGVLARRLDGTGRPIGEPFLVNQSTVGSQDGVALAATSDRFVVAYNSDMGVLAREFDRHGRALGGEFPMTKHREGTQHLQQARGTNRLAYVGDRLVCAWDGDAGLGDSSAVNISMLSAEPIIVAGLQGAHEGMAPAGYDGAEVTKTALASPHVPPTFDPKTISNAEREVVSGPRGVGFTGIVSTGWTPPDPTLAVGPEHVVVMTNGAIAFFTKDGTLTFQDEIENSFGFWGDLGTTNFVFDPEVLYDPLSGRFFAMAAEAYAPGNRSYVLIAVSDDSDPNGTWYKYRFDTTGFSGDLFDSPNMGVDEDVLYITGDAFGLGARYPVYTFDKASLLVGDPPAITQSKLLTTSTQSAAIPPVTFDSPPALYLVEHQEGSGRTQVRLIAVTDPLGSINFTTYNLTVPTYSSPGDPAQLGTSSRPETFDARFWSSEYRNGSLWATHHVNNPVEVRWYEIAMNGWPNSGSNPTLVQSGAVGGDGLYTTFTSIAVDDAGNAALCFARSSSSEYLSMATTYRLAGDPLGTMRPMVIEKQSTSPETSGRWGDYSGIEYDAFTNQFWAHHEYRGSSWLTWISSIDGLPDPCLGDFDGDGDRDQADLGHLLSAYGQNDGGDLDGDGDTDQADLGALLGVYGVPCP